ncbi:hypothetical protein ACH47Z_06150 [Streptomyces sp. NPDC020192]|uniref:hypothetical protein n=1 Tax=Streptomyces sp. NPDC020192 TaxID=3365066 RepID=UPI003787D9E3
MPEVAFGVGQVEDGARVARVVGEFAAQQTGVALELLGAAAAVGVVLDDQRVEVLLRVGRVGAGVLVKRCWVPGVS